jgi:hypothetical protein
MLRRGNADALPGLEIRLDENLDGLFAGMNLDPNRRVTKVNLMASSVSSANNGVGHYRLFQGISEDISVMKLHR